MSGFSEIDQFFLTLDKGGFAIPVTYINAAGAAKDLAAIFDDSLTPTQFGDMFVVNHTPKLLFPSKHVTDATNKCAVNCHAFWEDEESDSMMIDENGNVLILEGIAAYNVNEVDSEGTGMTTLTMTKD